MDAIAIAQRHLDEEILVCPDEARIMTGTMSGWLFDIRTSAIHNLPPDDEKEYRRDALGDCRELHSSFPPIPQSKVMRRSSCVS
jgi:hypothetical protein